MQTQWVVKSSFDACDYGPEYLNMKEGDVIVKIETNVPGNGLLYAQKMTSLEVGWFPPAFVSHL